MKKHKITKIIVLKIFLGLITYGFMINNTFASAGSRDDMDPTTLLNQIARVEDRVQSDIGRHAGTRIIVVGPTGTGKSTLIHAIAGKIFEAREDIAGKMVISFEGKEDQIIDGYELSENGRVGTTIPTQWYTGGALDIDPVVFWDCPGYGDPRGVTSDITNLFAIDRLFTPVNDDPCNIRIMLAIPFITGRNELRNSLITPLANLHRLFSDVSQLRQCLSIVITKRTWRRDGTLAEPATMFDQLDLELPQISLRVI